MSGAEQLLHVDPDMCILGLEGQVRAAAERIAAWSDAGLTVRTVRGRKARTVAELFDEFAAALQFPYYFGENWAAFDECFSDLSWLHVQSGIVVVILDAEHVLKEEGSAELKVLARIITDAASAFAEPIEETEWWSRPPLPFHVVLQGDSLHFLNRWRTAGASISLLEA